MPSDAEAALADARRAIADAVLGRNDAVLGSLGGISLTDHQRFATRQLRHLIASHGGAMLAERVGTGKTYIALAVASVFPTRLVVAPAALREMWIESAERARVAISVVSYESLSRGRIPVEECALVIFDEAHRLRNSATRQYGAATALTKRVPVLLLSATPVQNRAADLAAELALFLGRAAWNMAAEDLAAFVVRSAEADQSLPRIDGPHALALPSDDEIVDRITGLPSPVPAADEHTATALVAIGLLHQWASSRAALVAALKRRLARGVGLVASLEAGQYPSKAELSAWVKQEDSVQLAFPELASSARPAEPERTKLLLRVREHVEALRSLLAALLSAPDVDLERARLLREIRARHPGERIIAFAQYAESVDGLFRILMRDGRVASLSARGARIATGRLARKDVLAQFMPGGSDNVPEPLAVDLLLTTDVLSEGLNLQEASVVVHLDLPWNPARMDQRVGRVRRRGSGHARVFTYVVQPDRATERLLALEARLRTKLLAAGQTVGIAGRILPARDADPSTSPPSTAESMGRLRAILQTWQSIPGDNGAIPCFGAVRSRRPGFVAAVHCGNGPRLVAGFESGVSTEVEWLLRAAEAAQGRAVLIDAKHLIEAKQVVGKWMDAARVREALDLRPTIVAPNRRRALARIGRALSRSPRHRRSTLAPLVAAARVIATASLPEGVERGLDELLVSDMPDEAWLRAVVALGQHHASGRGGTTGQTAPALVALIVLQIA